MSNFQYQANLSYLKAGGKMYLDKAMYYKLIDDNYNRYPIGVRRNHLLLSSDKDNVEMSYNYDEGVFRLSELSKNTSLCNYIYETHLTELIQNDPYTSEAIFEEQLNKYLTSNCLIPYDIASRKIKFSSAFDDLGHYQTKYIA